MDTTITAANSTNSVVLRAAQTVQMFTYNSGSYQERMRIANNGNVGIGASSPVTKLDVAGGIRLGNEAAACAGGLSGTFRYNGGSMQFCNGSAWQTLGVSGAGLTSLNGQTGSTQNFAVVSTGTAPAINSASDLHTLNIPLASGAGVTSGTISKTDYDAFSAKLGPATVFLGDVSGTSTAISVDRIKGQNLTLGAQTSGNYLRNNGSG